MALAFVGGVAVAAVIAAVVGRGDGSASAGKHVELTTVTVDRRDLHTHIDFSGTLADGSPLTLASGLAGTVTEGVAVGAKLTSGTVLARVDGQPVTTIDGTTPGYRDLASGVADGADVQQLEAFLSAAGYGSLDVDQSWTSATTAAVRRWQAATGQDVTGTVGAAAIVFVPTGSTVTDAPNVGEAVRSGGTLATVEVPTAPTVTLAVPVADAERFKAGQAVDVVLTDGKVASGAVATVGSVAKAPSGGGQNATPTVTLTVTLAGDAGTPIEGPVTVRVPDAVANGVVAVPTRALIALAEGGQAVEVVAENGQSHLVRVEPGIYADGYVEVKNADLPVGAKVSVPK